MSERAEENGGAPGPDAKQRSLTGRVILLTRPREQAGDLARQLEQAGASVVQLPAIEIAPPDSWEAADAALRDLSAFDAVVFASANGVRAFCGRCAQLSIDHEKCLEGLTVFAVGRVTAEVLESFGIKGTAVPPKADGAHLADLVRGHVPAGGRILLPGGNPGRSRVSPVLRPLFDVVEVQLYQNRLPRSADAGPVGAWLQAGKIDAIAFFSPSSVVNLAAMIASDGWGTAVRAAIGPTTAAALEEIGRPAHLVSEEQSAAGFVRSLATYFSALERNGVAQQEA